jgi:hypothetical protein
MGRVVAMGCLLVSTPSETRSRGNRASGASRNDEGQFAMWDMTHRLRPDASIHPGLRNRPASRELGMSTRSSIRESGTHLDNEISGFERSAMIS